MNKYELLASEIGKLTAEKNKAYGDSFGKASDILKTLYPDGISPDSYTMPSLSQGLLISCSGCNKERRFW